MPVEMNMDFETEIAMKCNENKIPDENVGYFSIMTT